MISVINVTAGKLFATVQGEGVNVPAGVSMHSRSENAILAIEPCFEDRRITRSKKALRGALITLMEEKGFDSITVNDLFYNTPARMKFLKKDSSEGTFVADNVGHVALSHPEVSVKFIREGKLQYVTPGDGQLRSAAYAVLGREFSRDLIELDNREGVYRVWGLITQPKSCRASRSMQHFYINGRYVRNRTIMAGMEMAFKGTTMQGKFPGGILLLEMPTDLVDVNVHPAKTEVRFARENDIFDLVYHAVKLALAQPGTGERRFAFEEDKKDEESNKSGINDNAIEKDVKKNDLSLIHI